MTHVNGTWVNPHCGQTTGEGGGGEEVSFTESKQENVAAAMWCRRRTTRHLVAEGEGGGQMASH